jgi:hypothetical protein
MRLALFLTLLLSSCLLAQPEVLWQRTYGGELADECNVIGVTADSQYFWAGSTASFGQGNGNNGYLVKIDTSGEVVWSYVYGANGGDVCFDAVQANNGDFLLAGSSYSAPGARILRISPERQVVWDYALPGSSTHNPRSVIELSSGQIIVGGFYYESPLLAGWIAKLDSLGHIIWNRHYGGDEPDGFNKVIRTADGGIVAVGWSWSYANGGFWVTKITLDGDLVWDLSLPDISRGQDICELADGGLAAVASSRVGSQWADMVVVFISSDGDSFRVRHYSPCDSLYLSVIGYRLTAASGGGCYAAARTNRCDSTSQVAGWVICLDSQGDTLWSWSSGLTEYDQINALSGSVTGGLLVGGADHYAVDSLRDAWISSIASPIEAVQPGHDLPAAFTLSPAFPNPFNAATEIKFELPQTEKVSLIVYNLTGQAVATLVDHVLQAGRHARVFDGTNLSSGLYFYRLQVADQSRTGKLVLLK